MFIHGLAVNFGRRKARITMRGVEPVAASAAAALDWMQFQ